MQNRREFLIGSGALGVMGMGLGYKALTIPEIGQVHEVSQPTPMPTETAIPVREVGELTIRQDVRMGEAYIDYVADMHTKFLPFHPHNTVVITDYDAVDDQTLYFSQETLESTDKANTLPYLFSQSILQNILTDGRNHLALQAYSSFTRVINTSLYEAYTSDTREKVFDLLNPINDDPEFFRDTFQAFGAISTALFNNSVGLRERISEMETTYDDGYQNRVDAPEKQISKELIRKTLDIYEAAVPIETSNMQTDKYMTALFDEIGLLRYDLFRL